MKKISHSTDHYKTGTANLTNPYVFRIEKYAYSFRQILVFKLYVL